MRFGFVPKDVEDEEIFLKELRKRKVKVELFNKPGFWLSKGKVGFTDEGKDVVLSDVDLVFLRTLKPNFGRFSPENNGFMKDVLSIPNGDLRVINKVHSIVKANNKHLTQYLLEKHGVKMPEAFTSSDPNRVLSEIEDGRMSVIKPLEGSGGIGIVATSDRKIAGDVLSIYGRDMKPALIQEYIENPGRDIRLIVVGGEVLGGIYRITPKGMLKSNITSGGLPEKMYVDSELKELALKCARILELEIAGVDVIEGDDGYSVLEVNASPAFKGFMHATKINVPEKIVDYLVKEAKS